ncbi:MAG: BtrH N-terminal domain-containing protein [Pseudomonadales bacterium]|nr:BtrH N-terminal domain-containing protein [Pseudomonadales bacterium]
MKDFVHRQAAHCESGVMSSLLTHHGLPLSEPMAFGLASAASFALIPLVKLSGLPLIAYRMPPRSIIRGLQKRLGIRMAFRTFRHAERGMDALDVALDAGHVVGLQTSVFWLPYFPEGMRFHFNAHNLLVYGREGDEYLISDPVFEQPVRCERAALMKARFAKGALAAKGLQYQLLSAPSPEQFAANVVNAIPAAIQRNVRIMTGAPLPFVGVRGIRYMGKQLYKLAADETRREQYLPLYLGHIVRMQEEIGTGGAGFRFMYAAFLREASRLLDSAALKEAAAAMTEAGDHWRMFALRASKMCKGRETMDVALLDALLNTCADSEALVWQQLSTWCRNNRAC